MRVLLLGAGGFIGRHILSELLASGHQVRAVARNVARLREAEPGAEWVAIDLARATDPEGWRAHLSGIDCVVNAAGMLRGPEMAAVHIDMPRALHTACKRAEVRRIMLISAVSARPAGDTDYARSKLERYKYPREVIFLEALPRTHLGKVDRGALARQGR